METGDQIELKVLVEREENGEIVVEKCKIWKNKDKWGANEEIWSDFE